MSNSAEPVRGHSLEDIARLLELDFNGSDRAHPPRTAANDPDYTPLSGHDFFRVCKDTERTVHLTRLAGYLASQRWCGVVEPSVSARSTHVVRRTLS
jgi:hypothetical protein